MAIARAKKETILAELRDALQKAGSLVFVRFTGLTVREAAEMRRALKGENVRYVVVKKTLLKKALAERGYEGSAPDLPGEVAMAYASAGGGDATAPARGLQHFVKQLVGKLTFLGGVMEGKYLTGSEMASIAAIPDLKTLRGMFVNIINSPMQRFAVVLGEVAKKKA